MIETYSRLARPAARALCETAERLRDAPKHPHLTRVISIERVGDDGASITSEDVDGIALAEVFFRLSLAARLRIVVDVLAALSALHTTSGGPVIHGGVLLRATFVEKTGRAKVGCAYAQSIFMMKDSYAPESLLGDLAAIGPRTDVYGAGVLLWEAITGHELFGIDAPEEIVKKQLAGRIAKALPPSRDRWARTVLPVIERALAVNPNDRFASIAEMAAALRIAVRARLMTHEDIVEEIWPAATTPKVQSGTQPASEPIVAEAQAVLVVPTPSEPMAVSIGHTASTILDTSVVAHPTSSRRDWRSVAAVAMAIVASLAIVTVVHVRSTSHAIVAHRHAQPTTPTTLAPQDPSQPAASAPEIEREDVKPAAAPAASSEPAPSATHKAKVKSRFYDPSTI